MTAATWDARVLECVDGSELFEIELHAIGRPALADVVVIPPFGRTTRDLFLIAYALAANGFNVLRFDPRHHVGRSSGAIEHFTMSQVERDLDVVLGARRRRSLPLVLFGMSLSAPIVIKAAARRKDIAGVVTLNGVVDVPETIERAAGGSLTEYRSRRPGLPPFHEVFGYRCRVQPFVDDMDASGYGGLEDSLADVAAIRGSVHFVAAADDELVDVAKVRRLANAAGPRSRLVVLEGASHELGRSLAVAQQAMRHSAALVAAAGGHSRAAIVPPLTEAIEASAAEREVVATVSEPERRAA